MRQNLRSVIIGAGTYGEVYLSYLRESGVDVIGFIDDNENLVGHDICGFRVLGKRSDLGALIDKFNIKAVYCPIGNNKLRVQFLDEARSLGLATPNFIHKSVIIAPDVQISDEGVYILANSQIMPHACIDKYVMISASANISHHSHLSEGVFISTGVNLGANIDIKELAYVGSGSTIMTGVKVLGVDSLIGAGAVVIRDVPNYAVMAGVPAKVIKYKQLIDSNLGGGKYLTFKSIDYAA